ncbi:MAG: T9SS C-terminal target domain-containing protein [Ignavibacteriae bacterium]|nr:MAG: T9SS C-terminal target domain-containing protein [Ignavibacteriota bacterium]
MKNIHRSSFILLLFLFSRNCNAQSVDTPYEVATWQGFRSAAISYTFDDNCPNQLSIAVPMFNEFDFKLTLFTVTNPSWAWPANWNGLLNAAAQGHEIASHTVTHAHITGMPDSVQLNEFKYAQDAINSHIPGLQCVTIAYPYCETGNNSIVSQFYFAARGCSGVVESKTPANFMNISSIICGNQGSVNTGANFKSKADNAASTKGWCVYLFHGINGTEPGAYSPIPADTIRASLVYLKANQDKFWVSSFGNVARYIKERNSVSVKELANSDSIITVRITDTLDNAVFHYPVTLRRPLPQNWISASVSQNGKSRPAQTVTVGSVHYVMFDAVPDSGDITLKRSDLTNVSRSLNELPENPRMMQNYPNPFNPSTTITYYLHHPADISLKMYDLFGQELETLTSGFQSAGQHEVSWQPKSLASGIYFYRLHAGSFTDTKKLMLLK